MSGCNGACSPQISVVAQRLTPRPSGDTGPEPATRHLEWDSIKCSGVALGAFPEIPSRGASGKADA